MNTDFKVTLYLFESYSVDLYVEISEEFSEKALSRSQRKTCSSLRQFYLVARQMLLVDEYPCIQPLI